MEEEPQQDVVCEDFQEFAAEVDSTNEQRLSKADAIADSYITIATKLEDAGWVKVSARRAYGKIRPTAKQARILNDGQYPISQMLQEASTKSTPRIPQEIWE